MVLHSLIFYQSYCLERVTKINLKKKKYKKEKKENKWSNPFISIDFDRLFGFTCWSKMLRNKGIQKAAKNIDMLLILFFFYSCSDLGKNSFFLFKIKTVVYLEQNMKCKTSKLLKIYVTLMLFFTFSGKSKYKLDPF